MYSYKPLDKTRRDIRHVRVESIADGNIQCRIRHKPLDAAEYTALSYMWGSAEKPRHVTVLTEPPVCLPITESLYTALCSLFDLIGRWLWIDAICINQSDNEEKSWQVAMMRDIYHNTSARVLCWLGPPADGSDELFAALGRLRLDPAREILDAFVEGNPTGMYPRAAKLMGCGQFWPSAEHRVTAENAVLPFGALVRLFQRGYFERVWTKQETASMNKRAITFACGGKASVRLVGLLIGQLMYEACGTAAVRLVDVPGARERTEYEAAQFSPRGPKLDLHALHFSFMMGTDGKVALRDMMQRSRTRSHNDTDLRFFKASDPRDIVFGLFYLSKDLRDTGFAVDYDLDCAAVYARVTKMLIEKGHLDMLQWAGVPRVPYMSGPPGEETEVKYNLPSWVPDYARLAHLPFDWKISGDLEEDKPLYCACGPLLNSPIPPSLNIPPISFNLNSRAGNIIHLPAATVGSVSGVSVHPLQILNTSSAADGTTSLGPSSNIQFQEFAESLDKTERWVSELPYLCPPGSQPYGDSRALQDALYRTAKLDQVSTATYVRLDGAETKKFRSWTDETISETLTAEFTQLIRTTRHRIYGKYGFGTEDGHVGIAAGKVEVGDLVVIPIARGPNNTFTGLRVPVLLRKMPGVAMAMGGPSPKIDEGGAKWTFVGEAYVHGIMDGEVIAQDPTWSQRLQVFSIY